MSTIQPLGDRVLIQRQEEEKTTPGGIVIPDTAAEKPQRGTVVATGPGRWLDNGQQRAVSVSAGDQVLVGRYGGTEVKHDGRDYVIVREDEILAVIR